MNTPEHLPDLPFLVPLGKTAVFYVPAAKMDDARYGRDGKTPTELFDDFFLSQFGGLTHEESKIQGRWSIEDGQQVLTDLHERYEVTFDGDAREVQFLNFLSEMCALLKEESLYLTMGDRAWLVKPSGPLAGSRQ